MKGRTANEIKSDKHKEHAALIKFVSDRAREAFERPAYSVVCKRQCKLCKKLKESDK